MKYIYRTAFTAALTILMGVTPVSAQDKKPNILIIWGDDIGWFNINAYNRGMMGYKTPNIDRIANEGILFTDAYGQNSCTAGRSAFITGQSPFRTGLLKVGLPGAKEGIFKEAQLTLAVSCRIAVRLQSIAVSPPPRTITFFPLRFTYCPGELSRFIS